MSEFEGDIFFEYQHYQTETFQKSASGIQESQPLDDAVSAQCMGTKLTSGKHSA